MKFRDCLLILVLASISLAASAQNDSAFLSRAVSLLKSNSEKAPIEKVYLHLDKPYYAAGDDIWFKAYVASGSDHKLSGISGALAVELISSKNTVTQSVKLPLAGGLTWGDFKLPDTIKAGYYRLRAYTRWMRNAGSEYFYDRTIYIGNAIAGGTTDPKRQRSAQKKAVQTKEKALANTVSIQFFPESGSLVYGIRSRVAVKATGDAGLGKDVKGIVTDENNQEVARFTSQHLGMGEFDLLPLNGKTYKALLTFADGSQKETNLPAPQVKGYVMHIDNADPLFIEVRIEASKDLVSTGGGLNLVAQSGGVVCYAAESKSVRAVFTTMVPKSKFPSGIAQFTLFSASGEPLAERLLFIQKPGQLNLAVAASPGTFTTRGKMQINIEAKDGEGKPAFGNFSVSVTDETKVPADENAESTIFSSLLLSSDLKGYIEKPNYYFAGENEPAKEDLDVLMLTQGYRRFEWKQVLDKGFPPVTYEPETSLEITGRLRTLGGGRGIPYGKVSLMSSTHGFLVIDTTADDEGYFVFRNLQFSDSTQFVIQAKKNKDSKNLRVELDSMAVPPVTANVNLPDEQMSSDSDFSSYLDNSAKLYKEQLKYGIGDHPKALKEVKILGRKTITNSSNLMGPGNADQVVLMKDINRGCSTIAACLQGRLNLVEVALDAYGVGTFYSRNGKMAIYVDGILTDPERLSAIPPEVIESVEILISNSLVSVYGSEAHGGAILINTIKGGNYVATSPNIVTYTAKGYYKAREFYSPAYDDPKTNQQIADLRSTIYWNPDVATDKDGSACFDYFNSDGKGTYRLVIEGIDENGNLARQVYRYKVE
jgi:hypothetical protein